MTRVPENDVRWIESGGGPLILLPADLLGLWAGVPPSTDDPIAGDYARAVKITDYVGIIDVGRGQALVLGAEPMPATIVPEGDERIVIVRWLYAPSDEEAQAALLAARGLPYQMERFLFEHNSSTLVLIDAAEPGGANTDSITVPLRAGVYAVATAEYRPNDETHFIIHRLERL